MRKSDDIVAVLTGDLVGSTRLAPAALEQALENISASIDAFSGVHRRALIGKADFFRGDAWQLALREPGLALRLTILIRARLRAAGPVDTRIAIGIGYGEINARRVSLSTGEAFVASGRALDAMPVQYRLTGALPDRAGVLQAWFPALIQLADDHVDRWKRQQAETVALALLMPGATQEAIATALTPPVRRPTVSAALKGAGWKPLIDAVTVLEETDWVAALATGPEQTKPPVS